MSAWKIRRVRWGRDIAEGMIGRVGTVKSPDGSGLVVRGELVGSSRVGNDPGDVLDDGSSH